MSHYDALLARLLRRPRRPRRRAAVSRKRAPRQERAARADARGRRALPPLRRRQPDQRAEPPAHRRARARARRSTARSCRSTGAIATGTRCSPDTLAPDGRRRRAARLRVLHQRLQLLLRLPAVPREHRRAPKQKSAPRRRRSTSSASSSTIPASSSRWSSRVASVPRTQIPAAERDAVDACCSPPTASRWRWPTNCRYEEQLREASRLVAEAAGVAHWELVYQSRSGPPQQPWLEPDVCDRIEQLHAAGGLTRPRRRAHRLHLRPPGSALRPRLPRRAQLCDRLGVPMQRAATVGDHPRFVRHDPRADRRAHDRRRPTAALWAAWPQPRRLPGRLLPLSAARGPRSAPL